MPQRMLRSQSILRKQVVSKSESVSFFVSVQPSAVSIRGAYLVKRKLVKRRSPDGPKLRFLRFTLHERRFTSAALPLADC
jgi:hypothetical protein